MKKSPRPETRWDQALRGPPAVCLPGGVNAPALILATAALRTEFPSGSNDLVLRAGVSAGVSAPSRTQI